MNIVTIYRNEVDSWSGRSWIVAVAIDREAALRWIDREMDQDKTPEYWVDTYPLFSLKEMEVHE